MGGAETDMVLALVIIGHGAAYFVPGSLVTITPPLSTLDESFGKRE